MIIMKKRIAVGLFMAFFASALLTSCYPYLQSFYIEQRSTSPLDIQFDQRNFGIFTTIPSSEGVDSEVFLKDSVFRVSFSKGLAKGFETSLSLSPGDIPVFNQYMNRVNRRDSIFLIDIARSSASDMLVFVDHIKLHKLTYYKEADNSPAYILRKGYVVIPCEFAINIYDVTRGGERFPILIKDSIKIDIEHKYDLSLLNDPNTYLELINYAAPFMGERVADKIVPKWTEVRHELFMYTNPGWNAAYEAAMDFRWREAMDIWSSLIDERNAMQAGALAFNIAVACEIMGHYQLAIEWIDYAQKMWPEINGNRIKLRIQKRIEQGSKK